MDLTLIARQLRQVIADMGALRDDNAALLAMVTRLDGTVAATLAKVRTMHGQHGRLCPSGKW